MTAGAMVFMALSWGFVLGLTGWAFAKVLRHRRHHDPDGIGPAAPPEPGLAEPAADSRGPVRNPSDT